MVEPENRLFSQSDSLTALAEEQLRLKALSELGLLEAQTIPVFEEATQTTAHFLEVPICILGFVDQDRLRVRSAVGLSRLGLMNTIAQERSLPRHEAFCTSVVEKQQVWAINNTLAEAAAVGRSVLVEQYGIRAYLGAPLFDAVGHCLGAIAVMDLKPRTFTLRDSQFLELMARWSMSEFERNWLLKREMDTPIGIKLSQSPQPTEGGTSAPNWLSDSIPDLLAINQVKLEILMQLTHELRTPLTSILGMAGVVGREIYGPLTNKQKEYVEIIQYSGQHLLSLMNEISELGTLELVTPKLNPTAVDIEMLCQQASHSLFDAAIKREQEIRLSVEPGRSRIWILDKDKVRQLLYHLVFSVIHASPNRSIIRIHVSHKSDGLSLAVSVSHPWLGDGLLEVDEVSAASAIVERKNGDPTCRLLPVPPAVVGKNLQVVNFFPEAATSVGGTSTERDLLSPDVEQSEQPILSVADTQHSGQSLSSSDPVAVPNSDQADEAMASPPNNFNHRESLRLLLSCYMAQLHCGQISIQGTPESGYRYVVSLPELEALEKFEV